MAFLFALFNIYAIADDALQPTPQDTVVTYAPSFHVLLDATTGRIHDGKHPWCRRRKEKEGGRVD